MHFTAPLCVAVTPQARHIDTGPDFARSRATASASALVAAEALFGMNRSIASSITVLVITECPFSSARRRTPVRAIPFTCSGTCVIRSSAFIRGPYVEEFERQWAAASGAAHCVSCANGTDALLIAMKALGLGAGDEVIVPEPFPGGSAQNYASLEPP